MELQIIDVGYNGEGISKADGKVCFVPFALIGEVVETKVYKSFFELYAHYPKSVLGYDDGEVANPDDMLKYYSQENIDNYGVMAIEILTY